MPGPTHTLLIVDDQGRTTIVPLVHDVVTLGRRAGNTIRLPERNVSRSHARLLWQGGQFYIEDLQSYNGTKLNGTAVQGRAQVGAGDRIQIGDYRLSIRVERDTMTAAPTARPASPLSVRHPKFRRGGG